MPCFRRTDGGVVTRIKDCEATSFIDQLLAVVNRGRVETHILVHRPTISRTTPSSQVSLHSNPPIPPVPHSSPPSHSKRSSVDNPSLSRLDRTRPLDTLYVRELEESKGVEEGDDGVERPREGGGG